ncbi:MAG: 30S ribosome-binding factor RbfA [Candidatus Improbicoccus devescovinae]|nr:MAG: 30S ribosome-binding factor RbfA [Candidatus Improbicoccus devescovinae]
MKFALDQNMLELTNKKLLSRRVLRGSEQIKREISFIIMKLKDPRLNTNLLSVTRVWLSNDLSLCRIYISSLDGLRSAQKAAGILKRAAGYIKSELSNKLFIRVVPNMEFIGTSCIEDAMSMYYNIQKL